MKRKSTKSKQMVCHDCGTKLIREERPVEISYKGQSAMVQQPGWWCPDCGEGVLVGKDLSATEPAFVELKARVDGILTPAEVRRIRTKLKLSQRKASAILGGGPRAFQKYENGEVCISRAMSNLLRLLDTNPKLLLELEKAQTNVAA